MVPPSTQSNETPPSVATAATAATATAATAAFPAELRATEHTPTAGRTPRDIASQHLGRSGAPLGLEASYFRATPSPAAVAEPVVPVPAKCQRQVPEAFAVVVVLSLPALSVVTVLTVV